MSKLSPDLPIDDKAVAATVRLLNAVHAMFGRLNVPLREVASRDNAVDWIRIRGCGRRTLGELTDILGEAGLPAPEYRWSRPATPSGDRLVEFLYLLLRDYLPAGSVAEAMKKVTGRNVVYSNAHLEGYARDLAKTLRAA